MKKSTILTGILGLAMAAMTACSGGKPAETTTAAETRVEQTTAAETTAEAKAQELTIAAAASLEKCLTQELIPLFQEKFPNVTIQGTYDSSGKLQTQIEEGAEVDLFFSAAAKQMDALTESGLIEGETVKNLLENKIVLIVPTGEESAYTSFEDIKNAEIIALGDPESVPAGQYAREALTNLNLWEEVSAKASFGTNVTEVLNWVSEGSAEAGIVYATDAAQKPDQVAVVAEAPKDSYKKAVYPAGIVKGCKNQAAARSFLEFLQSDEAAAVFVKNGFTAVQ